MARVKRFNDPKLLLSNFSDEVWIKCPQCGRRAIGKANYEKYEARISCEHCGFIKTGSGVITRNGKFDGRIAITPHSFFDVELWLKMPFRDEVFWALNDRHLDYLERYISANLRESPNRTGFTMVEKLPKFMQYARNREPLLKLIQKMRTI